MMHIAGYYMLCPLYKDYRDWNIEIKRQDYLVAINIKIFSYNKNNEKNIKTIIKINIYFHLKIANLLFDKRKLSSLSYFYSFLP